VLFIPSITGSAQERLYVSGFVSDLATSQPLQYVNISVKGQVLSSTDQYGSFTVSVNGQDSIVFTRMGYKPYIYIASVNSWGTRILMAETSTLLSEVVITDSYKIHGYNQIKKILDEEANREANPWKNFTMQPNNANGMVQTFGPSIGVAIPWDKWGKKGREKKKLNRILTENERSAVYREFIHSGEVEEYMKRLFNIDDETYLHWKESFIIASPAARYISNRQDIIDLMVLHFASKTK
jgi:hypothetical protein